MPPIWRFSPTAPHLPLGFFRLTFLEVPGHECLWRWKTLWDCNGPRLSAKPTWACIVHLTDPLHRVHDLAARLSLPRAVLLRPLERVSEGKIYEAKLGNVSYLSRLLLVSGYLSVCIIQPSCQAFAETTHKELSEVR